MELMEDAVNVLVAFFLGASDVGVKGAVGALAPAEREMDVKVHSLSRALVSSLEFPVLS